MIPYFSNLSVALSVLLNVALGGDISQTFAARNWQRKKDNKFNMVKIIDTFLGRDYCAKQWAYWKVRKW
jgi:hypothetical protein